MKNKKVHIQLLPGNRRIPADPGTSLMESLMNKSIFLRSDCGGKGVCKKCRVEVILGNDEPQIKEACRIVVSNDLSIRIPETSMSSAHVITKAAVSLPPGFSDTIVQKEKNDGIGLAVDLGTTTIALYLCDMANGSILASLSLKNPQALYGDDVISRIGAVNLQKKNLPLMQRLVVRAIEWGMKKLLSSCNLEDKVSRIVVVGNPAMIHILAGIDPESIGSFPYQPAFYDARKFMSHVLGFKTMDTPIQVLPQVSGFIGGDILGAAVAIDLQNRPDGTLLVDLGTNGELMLKANGRLFATSCATGPAFEGASISCGMQAIPGAVNRVTIKDSRHFPEYTCITPDTPSRVKPSGICGTGVISAVAQLCEKGIIEPGGAFNKVHSGAILKEAGSGQLQYTIVPKNLSQNSDDIFISQKDIRSVQLGKAALITGNEFLLEKAGIQKPEKIIVAGAFGSYINKNDMVTLGMIPDMDLENIEIAGNLAGVGAMMVLCDDTFLGHSKKMITTIEIVDLAGNPDFQQTFINRLSFPVPKS